MSAVGIERKDSRGDTASVFAERMPYLSQLRYLDRSVTCFGVQGGQGDYLP